MFEQVSTNVGSVHQSDKNYACRCLRKALINIPILLFEICGERKRREIENIIENMNDFSLVMDEQTSGFVKTFVCMNVYGIHEHLVIK
jgi:hypothetical protein